MNTYKDTLLGKRDLLIAYLVSLKYTGRARAIFCKRFEAILHAYNPEWRTIVIDDFVWGRMIDEKCSDEKLNEIKEITGIDISENPDDPCLTVYSRRMSMFHALLKYRVQIEEIRKTFSGVMECSVGFNDGITHSENVNKEILSLVADKVDRVICLLLGDKYDESVSLSDLISLYGYPSFSAQKIRQMIIEDMAN